MSPVDAEFRPGNVIASRYELLAKLGEGGMGVVFKANDRVLGEEVALKLLRSVAASDPQYAQRLRSEIKLARRISHKNVCRIYEYGEDSHHHYIAMELIHGETLRSLVAERAALLVDEAVSLAVQVASGLEAIHEQHVVHRDLKPANVMLDSAGVAKVMDFGIAKRWDAASTQLTETGTIIGTPEYMSPEQAQGLAMDGRSDLYSLGLILYELMTGRVAFRGTTPVATLLLHVQAPPPLDEPEAARLPAPVLAVLRRALAKKPAERYSNAAEMRAALHEALARTAATAPGAGSSASRTLLLDPSGASLSQTTTAVSTSSQRRTPTELPTPRPLLRADDRRRRWSVAGLGLALLMGVLVLAASAWILLRSAEAPHVDMRHSATSPPATQSSPPTTGSRPSTPAVENGLGAPTPHVASAQPSRQDRATASPSVADRTASLSGQALKSEAGKDETRRGQVTARTQASGVRAPEVSLVLDETVFTPSSTADSPPGMGRLPPGVVARPADPGARIEADVLPPRLRPGDAYVMRFHLVNLRDAALHLNAASLRRGAEPPIMLRLETKVAQPLTRTSVGEARAVWTPDASGQPAMTFSILLEDGGLFACTLRLRP
jgi:serine/threonine protein kinase